MQAVPDPAGFLEDNRGFLLKYEAAVQLNLGNAQSHCGEACRPGLLFGRYEEQESPSFSSATRCPGTYV